MTFNEIRELCNGKKFVDADGIECVYVLRYDRAGRVAGVMADPTAKGKRHARYAEVKRILHDDWSTDLYQAPESEIRAIAAIVGGPDKLDALVTR